MDKRIHRLELTRRQTLMLGAAAGTGLLATPSFSRAASGRVHGLSAFGDLKYPADFPHFDYVNPKAPKGGAFTSGVAGSTFNSLNSLILKGDAVIGMGSTWASLMTRASDEPDALYGLIAESVEISADGREYLFHLRSTARFQDNSPVTAADVVFSLNTLKTQGHPAFRFPLKALESVEAVGPLAVKLRFAADRARDVPLIAAGLPILSAKYYETRKFEETTLEPPLGCGPYKVGKFEPGRFIEYERLASWWGADLPVNRGMNNFDVLRYEYFRDRDVAFQGFTARTYTFREEFTSRVWATLYDFPAIKEGRVKREVLPDETPSGAQGWMFNTRRPQFADKRVREAFALAFDFEWVNANLMYKSYDRTHSYFQNSPMMAKGVPAGAELALLEGFRDKLPAEVFGEPWVPPVSDGSGQDRTLLRRASALLGEAGWTIKDGQRVNGKGEKLTVEFLMTERTFEPHHQALIKNLRLLGIEGTIRLVEAAQYKARVESFDFDMTVDRMIFPVTPGETLRIYFTSESAHTKGSDNLPGIADPVVDALVDKVIGAATRDELTIACRALDRVLRAGRYWIPHWYKASHWIAYWDMFGRPATKPRYGRGIPDTWWFDADKAAKL